MYILIKIKRIGIGKHGAYIEKLAISLSLTLIYAPNCF